MLKAQQVLAVANVANFEEGLEKEIALQNRKWDKEKAQLETQLIEKAQLSQSEIELNEAIYQTIEEKTLAHLLKIKQLKDAAKIADLENMADATEPLDENMIELEQMQLHFDAKQALIDAQYEIEKEAAGNNQSALLAAEASFNRKTLANKNALIDAEFALTESKLANAQMYISTLAGVFSQESAMGKALFLVNQGLAIADIWVNIAKANAKAVAASPLTFGQPWVTANTLQGGLSTAMVLAQTVGKMAKFATGGFTQGEQIYMAGEAGTEWIAPNWMMENPSTAALIAILEKARTNKIGPNEAAIPQFATGGFSSSSSIVPLQGDERSGGGQSDSELRALPEKNNDNHIYQILEDLTVEIRELRKYRPAVAIEAIERERDNYIKIKQTSGL